MTNYERLLDLPLREVLKEIGNPSLDVFYEELVEDFGAIFSSCDCKNEIPACSFCCDVNGSCSSVFRYWLNLEADPNANYNDQCWLDADVELPPSGDTTERYLAVICGANQPTLLAYDGDNFIDPDSDDYITYKVKYWRPLPELPQNKPTE